MKILDNVKKKISSLGDSEAALILAHAAWSACDHRMQAGPSALKVSTKLDEGNLKLVVGLFMLSMHSDYSNNDQASMLRWLHDRGFSAYIAKQLRTTEQDLVDWVA